MLNMISTIENLWDETAVTPRPRFGMGACLHALIPAATPATTYAVALARPRTAAADAVVPSVFPVAAGQETGTQFSGKQPAYMTLIGASSAGALGPHPAREPV